MNGNIEVPSTLTLTNLDLMGMVIIGSAIGVCLGMLIVAGVWGLVLKGWYKDGS